MRSTSANKHKKQNKKTPAKTKGQKNLWLTISLAINAVFVLLIIAGTILSMTGALDYAKINKGINILCSERFKRTTIKDYKKSNLSNKDLKIKLAHIDFICSSNNDATRYHDRGFDAYLKYKGIGR